MSVSERANETAGEKGVENMTLAPSATLRMWQLRGQGHTACSVCKTNPVTLLSSPSSAT